MDRVGVHAALGKAGRAAGVGQHTQVFGSAVVHRRRSGAGQRLGPVGHAATGHGRHGMAGRQPVHPGRRDVGLGSDGILVMRHHQVRQALGLGQFGVGLQQVGREIGRADRDLDVRVGDVVLELLGPVHRIDRHHHRIGTQDGVVGHDPLRAVLHEKNHPVTRLHTLRVQVGRQPLDLVVQFTVGGAAVKEHQRRLVGITLRAHPQVEPQRGRWRCDGVRESPGPETVMGSQACRDRTGDGGVRHGLVSWYVFFHGAYVRALQKEKHACRCCDRPAAGALAWNLLL